MNVIVEIDLTRDLNLMERCKVEPKLMAQLKIYNAMDEGRESDSYLVTIGLQLWQMSGFMDAVIEHCDDFRYFDQPQALLFSFHTTQESACLFRMGCHAPGAVSIKKMVAGDGIEPPTVPV